MRAYQRSIYIYPRQSGQATQTAERISHEITHSVHSEGPSPAISSSDTSSGAFCERWLAAAVFVSFDLFVSVSRGRGDPAPPTFRFAAQRKQELGIRLQFSKEITEPLDIRMSFGAPGGGSVNYKPTP